MTIDRNETSRSRNANARTKAKTIGTADFIASFQSFDAAVSPVTAYSMPSTVPTVAGRSSSRRVASASFDALSVPLPDERDRDPHRLASRCDLDPDRLERLAGGERPLLEICDGRLELGIGRVARDRDDGGGRSAGERVVDAVVRLRRLQRLRQCVEAGDRRVQVERREGQDDEHGRGTGRRDERTPEHAVEDRAPDARARRPCA